MGHREAELCCCGTCQAPVRSDQRASQASSEGGVERVAGHRSAEPPGRGVQLPAGNPFDRSVIEQRQALVELGRRKCAALFGADESMEHLCWSGLLPTWGRATASASELWSAEFPISQELPELRDGEPRLTKDRA